MNEKEKISTSWEDCILSFIKTISQPPQQPTHLLSTLYNNYFPSDDKDIFTKLHSECKDFFKPGVIEKELKNSAISKIKQNLKNYCDCSKEKREGYMNGLVESCDFFYKKMTTHRESVQFVGVMITFSFLHLAILSERNTHELQIYTGWDNRREKQLEIKIEEYKKYFIDIYQKWQDWRKDQITMRAGVDPKKKETIIGEVLDTITTSRSVTYSSPKGIQDKHDKFKDVCTKVKIRFFNEINAEFMKLYVHTFALNKFYWDKHGEPPKAPKSVATVWYGTYGRDTFPDGAHDVKDCEKEYELSKDLPGVITGVNIHEYNVLDALKFFYKGHPGELVGNPLGGHVTTIRGLDEEYNHIVAVDLYFCHRVMCAIQFFFSDGETKMGILGNRSKAKNAKKISCGPIGKNNDFKLTEVRMASSTADLPEDNLAVGHIALCFEHVCVEKEDEK